MKTLNEILAASPREQEELIGYPWCKPNGDIEYGLYDAKYYNLCPNRVYVGGISRYICHCDKPKECLGVQGILKEIATDVLKGIAD